VAAAWVAAGAQGVAVDATPAPAGARPSGPAPVRIDIPGIGVSAPVDPTELNPDGTLRVPEDFARTSWYTGRPVPGEVGPAIIVGHVDNRRGPAVFYRLRELDPGNEVIVHRADGSQVVFATERKKEVPKNDFPTEEVYGPTAEPTLRLITCGGSFDRSTRHYRDNVVVFLRMKA
jgi:sortase (surface protein transpeptidase)